MDCLRRIRIGIVPNKMHSAHGALARWQRRGLWGPPIWLGPTKCHVYGVWRKRVRMDVEFTDKSIVFIVHLNRKEKACAGASS